MTGLRSLFLVGVVLLLLVAGLVAGVWFYLSGPNEIDSASLAPGNTVAFISIPNGATLLQGYGSSHAKTLIESPNSKPLLDTLTGWVGQKNVDLFTALLPCLSGQSFIAITHYDYDHPEKIGLVAAMKPKTGLSSFSAFLDKLKATWPDIIKQGTTGTGNVLGVDYEWIQGPGAQDKICVAHIGGWIVTTWGEATLQDWIERYRKKSSTSSLAEDLNYRKALGRVGDDPTTLIYLNYHAVMENVVKSVAKTNPAVSEYLTRKIDTFGGAAVGSRFENGEIVDRYTFLVPLPTQVNVGIDPDPCQFETLKFTGPYTQFYWAADVNWKQYYNYLRGLGETEASTIPNSAFHPIPGQVPTFLQNWLHGTTLDPHQNIVDALGPEISLQVEWNTDAPWPEAGLFIKLAKPDDFKPTIAAIIDSVRSAYSAQAVISELNSNGQKFATLQFVNPSPLSPTITEDGPYLGVFLTANQAVRSFQRTDGTTLAHNPDFIRQTGDKLKTATQVVFLDSPRLLDRGYQTALPYLSLGVMFDKNLAQFVKGRDLPQDLTWLAPIDTWTGVVSTDEEGIQVYSTSGIGNQGVPFAGALQWTSGVLQSMGIIPRLYDLPAVVAAKPAAPVAAAPTVASSAPAVAGTAPASALPILPMSAAVSAPPPPIQESGAIIYITPDSKIFYNSTPVPLEQIGGFLQDKKNANANLKPVIHIDRDASQDVLSRVMDAGTTAGFGVLPYTSTSGPDSVPPSATAAAAASVAPASPGPTTNAAPDTSSIPNATSSLPSPATTQ